LKSLEKSKKTKVEGDTPFAKVVPRNLEDAGLRRKKIWCDMVLVEGTKKRKRGGSRLADHSAELGNL